MIEKSWLVSRAGVVQEAFVTLGDGGTESMEGLQIGFKVLQGRLETLVMPVVLFDASQPGSSGSVDERNRKTTILFERIQDKSMSNHWLNRVFRVFEEALGRVINLAAAAR